MEKTAGKYVKQLENILLIRSLGGVWHFRIYLLGINIGLGADPRNTDLDKEFHILADKGKSWGKANKKNNNYWHITRKLYFVLWFSLQHL